MSIASRGNFLHKHYRALVSSVRGLEFVKEFKHPLVPKMTFRPTGFLVDPWPDPHSAEPLLQTTRLKLVPEVVARDVKGIVSFFDAVHGYGTIKRLDTEEDVFVYWADILRPCPKRSYANLTEGESVEFCVKRTGASGLRAIMVTGPGDQPVIGKDYNILAEKSKLKMPVASELAKVEVVARRIAGVAESYSVRHGFGYISWPETDTRILVLKAGIAAPNPDSAVPSLAPEEPVEFDLATSEQGLVAVNVTGPETSAVRGQLAKEKFADLLSPARLGLRIDLNNHTDLFRPY